MEGHAAHGGTFFLTAGLAGQGQFQFARSRQRIVIKHLIEIPYAVEKDFIGMLLLDIKILLHHGRQFQPCSYLFLIICVQTDSEARFSRSLPR